MSPKLIPGVFFLSLARISHELRRCRCSRIGSPLGKNGLVQRGQNAAAILEGSTLGFSDDTNELVHDVYDALYGAKIISYAQGYMLLRGAAKEYGWNLQYGSISSTPHTV